MASIASMREPRLLFCPAVLVALTVMRFQSVMTSADAVMAAAENSAVVRAVNEEFFLFSFIFFWLCLWFHQKPAWPDSNPARVRLGVVRASLGRVGKLSLKRRVAGDSLPAEKFEWRHRMTRIVERGLAPRLAWRIKSVAQEQPIQLHGWRRLTTCISGCWHVVIQIS